MLASLQGLAATLTAMFQTRLALLATEVEEEKQRLLAVMGWGALAILMGTVASVFLAGFITVLFWDSHPLLALGGLTVAFGVACAWAVHKVGTVTRPSQEGMLAASLAELQADHEALLAAAQGRQGHAPTQPDAAPRQGGA